MLLAIHFTSASIFWRLSMLPWPFSLWEYASKGEAVQDYVQRYNEARSALGLGLGFGHQENCWRFKYVFQELTFLGDYLWDWNFPSLPFIDIGTILFEKVLRICHLAFPRMHCAYMRMWTHKYINVNMHLSIPKSP